MEGSPNVQQIHRLESDLKSNSSILSIHDLHVWALTTNRLVASVHIVVNDYRVETKEIENFATDLLKQKYGISKTTIQIEVYENCETCHIYDN